MPSSHRRIQEAVAGTVMWAELTAEEGLLANMEIDASIAEAAIPLDYGAALARVAQTAVAFDHSGRLRRYRPDGTSLLIG